MKIKEQYIKSVINQTRFYMANQQDQNGFMLSGSPTTVQYTVFPHLCTMEQ